MLCPDLKRRKAMPGRIFVAGGGALALGIAAWLLAGMSDATRTAAPGMGNIADGKRLYGEYCASCHGANLEGAPNWQTPNPDGTLPAPPHDATGHTWHHDDTLLFEYIRLGGQAALAARGLTDFRSGMPPFGEILTDAEISSILAYIKSTWPSRIRESQARRNRGG